MKPPKRPRRKAKQERALATVEAVLDAAAQVLEREGYAAATTNRLAGAAGVSIGTLYEYFANRDEVFDALIRRELARLVTAFENRAPLPDATLMTELAAMLGAGMAAMQRGPALFRALEHVPGATFRGHLEAARGSVVELIRGVLERHRAELRVRDLDRAAFVAVTAVEGVVASTSNERFDADLARELEDLLRCYLLGSVGGGDRVATD